MIQAGDKFGKLTVVGLHDYDNHGCRLWRCECECGRISICGQSNLKRGASKSCGYGYCKYKYGGKSLQGGKRTRLYQIWKSMHQRCTDPSSSGYHNYGARGISVCPEWNNYDVFYEWATNNGYRDDLTLDRIDNYGDYTPQNCRWTTIREQGRNRRFNRIVTYKGESKTVMAWAEDLGMRQVTLHARLFRYGWPVEKAFTQPERELVTYQGETRPVPEWAKKFGINRQTLNARIFHQGWPIERALTEPVRKKPRSA